MPSINSARYAQRIIQTESHESPSFLRKVHRLDPPDTDSHNVSSESDTDSVSVHRCQPSSNRAGNPAFWLISRIPAFLPERPVFLALFRNNRNR